ncbi:hypothetical protein [Streptomyces sp. NPDC048272]|uniref:hypothetical protein n=1 Tax=Streptomyces sp. NPDC048272 TaxID=3154616 RepID=UPI0034233D10
MRPRESRDRDATPRPLAEFLARAGVRDRYPHYDLGAAEARLLRPPRAGAGHRRLASPPGWSDPARDVPLDAERARRDLKSACLGAVCDPNAEARLASFARGGHTDLAGAVVFGCLLHLSGLREGARFWWQFAAGSGRARTAPAAYCLFLDHSRRGEHHDARVWARELGRRGYRPTGHRELREVRLCAQAAVLRYVDQLDDPDLGPVPLPRPGLTTVLAAFRPSPAPPAPAAPGSPGAGPPRRPAPTTPSRAGGPLGAADGALAEARRALAVVRVLERRPLGVRTSQLGREAGLAEAELAPLLSMLCEEGYACRPGAGVYGRGPALDRLAAPGLAGLAGQLRRALAPVRDGAGTAVPLGRYPGGEVGIPRPADGGAAAPGWEWVDLDLRAGAHAAGLGTCPFTGLDHDLGADGTARPAPPAVVTDSRVLFHALDPMASGTPVSDLRAHPPGGVCPVAPIESGAAGCLTLSLSLPAPHAHRLRRAGDVLRRTAVPVLLALLLSGAIPTDSPAVRVDVTDAANAPSPPAPPVSPAGITPETLRHLRKLFRTPVGGGGAVPDGPHLVSDPVAAAAYLFAAVPEDAERPRLALPHTFAPLTPGSLTTPGGLVVLGTDET